MYDVLIRSGFIVDGSGQPGFIGDVAIKGERIVSVAPEINGSANREIEAEGLVVCPGFIDVHSHDDLAILHDPDLAYKLLQGITTTIVGNCGHGVAPMPSSLEVRNALRSYVEPVLGHWENDNQHFGFENIRDFYDAIDNTQHSLHVGALVGHGPLRVRVMGFSDRIASDDEINLMQELLHEAMEGGALGLSLGLMYAPGCFASQKELVALAKTVKTFDGIVTAHIRGEGDFLLPSIEEMLDIARATKVSMHISHLKAVGRHNWGTVGKAIQLIRDARANGLDVTCDAYPYTAGSTTLLSLLPPWVLQQGVSGILERLSIPQLRQRIYDELTVQGNGWENVAYITGWDRVVLSSSPLLRQFEGKSIADVATLLKCDPIESYFQVIEGNEGIGTIVIHHMDSSDVKQVLLFEHSTVGSDGLPSKVGHPHPRLYGTFARFVSKYVRDEGYLTIEQGIQKITSYPVTRFKLGNRGNLLPNFLADIAIFDLNAFSDVATYSDPKQHPTGLRYVLIHGDVIVDEGSMTEKHPGTLIRRTNQDKASEDYELPI